MIPKIPFGSTGHLSTRTIFGAAALGNVTPAEAEATLELLRGYGVNHIDTAASYGRSEERLGPLLEDSRNDYFLATKTGARDFAGARAEIHRSLERLQVTHVDLLQLHNLVDQDEWNQALGPGGALEAAIEARADGLVRFIGVTGHGLQVARRHLESLGRFDFDSVLLPYNYIIMRDREYAADFHKLRAICRERGVAVQTIKAVTRRPWGDQPRTAATWYQPYAAGPALEAATGWVLGLPNIFLNTVGDIHVLPHVLEAASRFTTAPTDEEMARVVETEEAAPLFV